MKRTSGIRKLSSRLAVHNEQFESSWIPAFEFDWDDSFFVFLLFLRIVLWFSRSFNALIQFTNDES